MTSKQKTFNVSLDKFLASLDNLKGMDDISCLQMTQGVYRGKEPTIKLYKNGKLVASTNKADYEAGNVGWAEPIVYPALAAIKKCGKPISVGKIDRIRNWGGITVAMAPHVLGSLLNLEKAGVVKAKDDSDPYTDFEIVTTSDFGIEYQPIA
jgi:hypothetical protein